MTVQPEREELLLWVTYWPSRTGSLLWQDYHADEVRRDLDQISAAGITRLLLTLPWSDFQPDARRVSLQSMRALEQILQFTVDARILALVSVLSAQSVGEMTIPGWVRAIDTSTPGPAREVIRNLYADPDVIAPERRALEEIVGEFSSHPAVDGWLIADRFSSITPPPSAQALEEWIDLITSAGTISRNRLWHGIGVRELVRAPALEVSTLARHGVGPFVHLDWRPPWASDDRVWEQFVAGFSRFLSGTPPVVIRQPGPRRSSTPPSDEDVYETIQHLRNAGAGGVVAPSLFDRQSGEERLRRGSQSLDRSWAGLLTVQGMLTEAGRGWVRALNDRLEILQSALPDLDPAERARDPELFTREAFDAFTR